MFHQQNTEINKSKNSPQTDRKKAAESHTLSLSKLTQFTNRIL